MNDALRLPKINPVCISEAVIDRIGSVFYPHAQSHREVVKVPPTDGKKTRRKNKKSKSMASLDVLVQAEASRLLAQDDQKVKLIQYKLASEYEKKTRNYSSIKHQPYSESTKPFDDPELLMNQKTTKKPRMLTKSIDKSRAYSSLIKEKQDSLKSALTVEKPKVQTIESRLKIIMEHIFPIVQGQALNKFIGKFDEMINLTKKSKQEQKKVQKLMKSDKIDISRKVQLLKEKKKKIQAELEDDYEQLFQRFAMKDERLKENEQVFKRKFKKQLKKISKTMILDKIL